MKIKLVQKESLLKEIKATEDFRFDKAFLDSLKKPGKRTFIRFTDEMPGGEILLTPNLSRYAHGHTPAAIYGYPIDNMQVVTALRDQSLQFNDLPIIVVYSIDEDKIVNLNSLTKEEVKSLFDQIISIKGKDAVVEALNKWLARIKQDDLSRHWGGIAYMSTPALLLKNGLDVESVTLTHNAPGELFWNLIRYIGTGLEKTALLLKLRLKQRDSEGREIERRFNTIVDEKAVIDTADPIKNKSQAPIQALTLTSAGIGRENIKLYNNPSASVKRRYNKSGAKRPDETILLQKNFERFEKYKNLYFSQLGGLKRKISENVTFDKTSTGYKITMKMPAPAGGANIQKSIVKRILALKQKKNPATSEQDIAKYIAEQVVSSWLRYLDGPRYEPGRAKFDSDLHREKVMIVKPEGDYFEFNINVAELSSDILSPTRVYSFLYFLFDALTQKSQDNPFFDWKTYFEISKIRTQHL